MAISACFRDCRTATDPASPPRYWRLGQMSRAAGQRQRTAYRLNLSANFRIAMTVIAGGFVLVYHNTLSTHSEQALSRTGGIGGDDTNLAKLGIDMGIEDANGVTRPFPQKTLDQGELPDPAMGVSFR